MTADFFERLGLPRRFSLDPGELERAYLARSRAVHPDYHVAGPDTDLAASLELSAAVNEAYNTLKDPFSRAEYLLALAGDAPGPVAKLPPAFLAEMLEVRERVGAARGKPAEGETLKAECGARLAALAAEVGALFGRHDSLPAEHPDRANLRARLRGLLSQARYVRRLIEDLHAD